METGERAERMLARRARVVRGTVAAAVAVLLASTAHTVSGGDAPPLWLIAAVTVLAAPLCVALVGRRRSVVHLATAVAAAQIALHTAFAAVGTAAPSAPAALAALAKAGGAHHHDALLLTSGAVDPEAATMTAGHALAAVLTVVLLAWGERMLAALGRGVRQLFRAAPTASAPMPRIAGAPATFSPRCAVLVAAFLRCVTRRGPPARLVPNVAC